MKTRYRLTPKYYLQRYMISYILLVFLVFEVLIWSSTNPSSMVEVPVDIHLPILLNVLTFDRNFKHRVDSELVIGILYQEKFRESLNVKKQIEQTVRIFDKKLLPGVKVTIFPINLEDIGTLKSSLEKMKINVIYISPVRAVIIKDIWLITRELKIISLTGVPEYCSEGISVGIGVKGGSSQIIVNLMAANAEGIDFSSRLLKLAKVIDFSDRK